MLLGLRFGLLVGLTFSSFDIFLSLPVRAPPLARLEEVVLVLVRIVESKDVRVLLLVLI